MRWEKLGQIYYPEYIHPKLASHAANPLAILLEGDVYRIFYSGRDTQNRSSVGFVDVDIIKYEVTYVHHEPAFEHGSETSFYSHGVSIGNCYATDKYRYILFMGWKCPSIGHWRGSIGRLILETDYSLRIDSSDPLISLGGTDQISLSYPWVIQKENGSYQMWYGSTVSWDAGNGEMLHVINHASSHDGHCWERKGLAVPYVLGIAQAFSRPSVVRNRDEGYSMWFSYRGKPGDTYRIGYACSQNNINWELRLNEAGIDVSSTGWDSEMIEYPFVFDHKGQRFMLYNGNGYGKTGFGLAVLTHG